MNLFSKRVGAVILSIAIIAGSFGGGIYYGRHYPSTQQITDATSTDLGRTLNADFSSFWKAWKLLEENYVPTKGAQAIEATDQEMVWAAIEGLASAYEDPYTVFFPPEEAKQFQTQISGNFEGVGMEMGEKNGVITVISPLKNTPAFRAGIKSGDQVLKINGTLTVGMTVDEAVSRIRGKKGTTVTLTVLHENAKQPEDIKIVREVINIPTLDTETKDGVFIIHLYNFSENSPLLFRNAIQEFSMSGTNKLVLDLRGNPGGYLEVAVDMASWFLPADKVVVKEESKNEEENLVFKSRGYNIFNKNLKMVILVDGGSASASEILAGALSEHGVAKLVGTKTFGKGSVQELLPLTSDTSLKITVARWLTPNGNSISEQGLKPDVEVELTAEDFDKGNDPQMAKAIEILNTK